MCSNEYEEIIPKKRLKIRRISKRPTISTLPTEIIEKIFTYLRASDIITISSVCKKWYKISQLKCFRKNILLKLRKKRCNKLKYAERVICKSKRKFCNFYYGESGSVSHSLRLPSDRFLKMSNTFKYLESFELESVIVSVKVFCKILNQMPKLNCLTLKNIYFERDENNEIDDSDIQLVKDTLSNIRNFEYDSGLNADYEVIAKITAMLTNLETFWQGNMHYNVYEDAVTETEILCSTIKRNKNTLRKLHLPTYQNTLPMSSVYQIQDLKLTHLSVDYDYYSPPATLSLDTFLQAYPNVTTLMLSIKSYKKLDLDLLTESMPKLERLEIAAERKNIHHLSLLTLSKFKKLKIFKALNCPAATFSKELLGNNLTLKELQIQNMDLDENHIINICESLPNLESLTLQSIILTDGGLQSIITNLPNLKSLYLMNASYHSSQIREYGVYRFRSKFKSTSWSAPE